MWEPANKINSWKLRSQTEKCWVGWEFINSKGKGVTRLDGIGAYTGQKRPVLISLLEPRQVVQLKLFLKERDPKAFVSICDATEVLGQGFKSWRSL